MGKLFITILNNTLIASWMILAVIVLRLAFKRFINKIPKGINCLLWGLVAIRLVLPFRIESIFSLIPSAKPIPVDIEYACDEKVTRDRDKEWKATYCQVLLDCSSERRMISACPVAFGEVSVKDRVKSVINYKKPTFWITVISIIICLVIGVSFLTSPKENKIGATIEKEDESDQLIVEGALASEEKDSTDFLMNEVNALNNDLQMKPDSLHDQMIYSSLARENIFVPHSEEENMGVSYREDPITHDYIVDGDMVLKYKRYLVGKDPIAAYPVEYIVLTNDENITWEKVHKSLFFSNSADWLYGTIIIGINTLVDE